MWQLVHQRDGVIFQHKLRHLVVLRAFEVGAVIQRKGGKHRLSPHYTFKEVADANSSIPSRNQEREHIQEDVRAKEGDEDGSVVEGQSQTDQRDPTK